MTILTHRSQLAIYPLSRWDILSQFGREVCERVVRGAYDVASAGGANRAVVSVKGAEPGFAWVMEGGGGPADVADVVEVEEVEEGGKPFSDGSRG